MGADVDLVIFHEAGMLLQRKILEHGKLVYEISRSERTRRETRSV